MTCKFLWHILDQSLGARLLAPTAMLCVLMAGACSEPPRADSGSTPSEDVISFRVDGRLQILRGEELLTELEIEIADDDSTRTRGMMQRTQLPTDRGMLFLFDSEEDRLFWMANTPLSLDLIFISADSTVIHTAKYMRPLSPQDVPSEGPAQFVLELIAGNADTIGIVEGDHVSWKPLSPR